MSGEFGFAVDAVVLDTMSVDTMVPPPGRVVMRADSVLADVNTSPLAVAMRWANFIVLLLALGVVAVRTIIVPNSDFASAPHEYWATLDTGLRRLGVLSGMLVLLAAVPRFLLQSSALFGRDLMFEPSGVRAPLTETVWGVGWLVQAGAGLGLLLAALLPVRLLAVAAALALALTPALSGHAAASDISRLPLPVTRCMCWPRPPGSARWP